MRKLWFALGAGAVAAGLAASAWFAPAPTREGTAVADKFSKTEAEWQRELTPDQYRVARKHGTEPAFTGEYWNTKDDGVYACVCCGQPLFDSATKYDSGTGWPSFWEPAAAGNVETQTDRSWLMSRTEVHCSRCEAHLGHVFPDGPEPTGQRYCINSASLKLKPRDAGDPGAAGPGER